KEQRRLGQEKTEREAREKREQEEKRERVGMPHLDTENQHYLNHRKENDDEKKRIKIYLGFSKKKFNNLKGESMICQIPIGEKEKFRAIIIFRKVCLHLLFFDPNHHFCPNFSKIKIPKPQNGGSCLMREENCGQFYECKFLSEKDLILLIRNVENKDIIHAELCDGAVDTEIFINFLNNIKLPTDEKYYLLLDRLSSHKAEKVKELLASKNIEPRYIVACNPYLNPVEEVFNKIKERSSEQFEPVAPDYSESANQTTVFLTEHNDFSGEFAKQFAVYWLAICHLIKPGFVYLNNLHQLNY
ncbi:2397_t:CDS:2, partial [Racocetra persica]